ncbi:MAG: hypothetical protein ACRDT0_27070 [Pseudonocardiaceae bacterium]
MIREDRELLAELALINGDVAQLAMRMMEGSANAAEQHDFARRLIAAGEWLHRRADATARLVVEGDVIVEEVALPSHGDTDAGHYQEP